MNRAAKRFAAYVDECLARAAKGGRHWLRLPLAEFMKATGYAERTARQAWADVRERYETRLRKEGRTRVSMVALQGTLTPCKTQYKGGIPSELEKRNNTEQARQAAPGRSKFSEAAPAKMNATLMGGAFLSLFVGSVLMGWVGSFYSQMTPARFWALDGAIGLAGGVLVFAFKGTIRAALGRDDAPAARAERR